MLKDRVVNGVAWSATEKVVTAALQAVVTLILFRLLTPHDYGVVAIPMVFSTIALVAVDSGFSQALIRSAHTTQRDLQSVFLFNLGMALVLYAALVLLFRPLAGYYDLPELRRVAPVLFLRLPLGALCVIQNTVLTRRFAFRRLSLVLIGSSLTADALAIGMAWMGMGLWALVVQYVAQIGVRALLFWVAAAWRPGGGASFAPLRRMFGYSSRLLATDLLNTAYNNVSNLFIGRIYSPTELAYFNQGLKIREMTLNATVQSVQSVTFPALSNLGDNPRKFSDGFRQVVSVTNFLVMPVMVGLALVAREAIPLLVGTKWLPSVPFIRIIALTGFFVPTAMIAYNVLKVRSNGAVILRLELVKKGIMTAVLAVTIPWSVEAVAWGFVVVALVEALFNYGAARRFTGLGWGALGRMLLPPAAVTGVMALVVAGLGVGGAAEPSWLRLAVRVVAGAVVYGVVSRLFRLDGLAEVGSIVRNWMTRWKGNSN